MAAKFFSKTPKVDADAGETTGVHTIAYDSLINGPILLQYLFDHFHTLGQCEACTATTPVFEDLLNRVSIWGQFRDSTRPDLRITNNAATTN